ncbi:MAG TPA: hypothetical protein VFZ59_01030 [Verrucomicrobiae bacterium]|nr:hypothetical protein [Verrucomicrobiae bacterium]
MTIISRITESSDLPGHHRGRRATKSTLRTDPRRESLRERLLNAVAPLGYQDELGFHYGLPPAEVGCFN